MTPQNGLNNSVKSNIELLRICSTVMIIMYHYVVHGMMDYFNEFAFWEKLFLEMLSVFGKIGVNIFVLISGYLSADKMFRLSKVIKLIFQTEFFSVVLMTGYLLSGGVKAYLISQ